MKFLTNFQIFKVGVRRMLLAFVCSVHMAEARSVARMTQNAIGYRQSKSPRIHENNLWNSTGFHIRKWMSNRAETFKVITRIDHFRYINIQLGSEA